MNSPLKPTVELRDYQQAIVDQVWQSLKVNTGVVIGLATGAGKTIIAGQLSQMAIEKGFHPVFITDRIVLVEQAREQFANKFHLNAQILQGANTFYLGNPDCTICTIQTLTSRLEKHAFAVGLCNPLFITDEAHILHENHLDLFHEYPDAPRIGLSATPERDGLASIYDDLIRGPSIDQMTSDGYLVPVIGYGPSKPDLEQIKIVAGEYDPGQSSKQMTMLVADCVKSWKELGDNRRTIVFAVNIAHAEAVTRQFKGAGIRAEIVNCRVSSDERKALYAAFHDGEIKILVSIDVLTLGFDEPRVGCLVLARPTKSTALHIQQLGRGLRPATDIGKQDCIIIDHTGNCERHGMPADYYIPDLTDGEITHSSAEEKERLPVQCNKCFYLKKAEEITCPKCGHVNEASANVEVIDSNLVEMEKTEKKVFPIVTKQVPEEFYRELRYMHENEIPPPMSRKLLTSQAVYMKYVNRYGEPPDKSWNDKPPLHPTQPTINEMKRQGIAFMAQMRAKGD